MANNINTILYFLLIKITEQKDVYAESAYSCLTRGEREREGGGREGERERDNNGTL